MGKYEFAKSSIQKLQQVDSRLVAVLYEVKERSIIDFDISEGHRSVERQQELYNMTPPKTQLDG